MDDALFTTQDREYDLSEVPVRGTVPGWLSGSLFRNGPAVFEQGPDRMRHFFDGYAMLHRFSFGEGTVSYRSRILETEEYENDRKLGRIAGNEWGTAAWYTAGILTRLSNLFDPAPVDNTNVTIVLVGGRYVALSDFSTMVPFDPDTLRSCGHLHFTDRYGDRFMAGAAHPSADPDTGDLFDALSPFGPSGDVAIYRIAHDAPDRREILARIRTKKQTYFHSFGLTPGYFIFIEMPYELDILRLVTGQLRGIPLAECYDWKPENGTRFHVVGRKDGSVTTFLTDAFFVFHTVNAFEEGGKIVLDISAYPDASINTDFFLDHLLTKGLSRKSAARLTRFTLDPGSGTAERTVICPGETFDLPRISRKVAGKAYRYAYGLGMPDVPGTDFPTRILKIDLTRGTGTAWEADKAYPGEPVFVARPGGAEEDDGVVLSLAYDGRSGTSFLLILDGGTMTEVARAVLPHRVPFGLHGIFVEGYP